MRLSSKSNRGRTRVASASNRAEDGRGFESVDRRHLMEMAYRLFVYRFQGGCLVLLTDRRRSS